MSKNNKKDIYYEQMACHKVGYFLEQGIGCELAIGYYKKAFDEGKTIKPIFWDLILTFYILGYPDSAHNLGLIHQGFMNETAVFKDIKKSIEYFERAKQWGYSPSCNACMYYIKERKREMKLIVFIVGRMYLLMSKNAGLAEEAGNPGSEPEDYVVTGIELMEASINK